MCSWPCLARCPVHCSTPAPLMPSRLSILMGPNQIEEMEKICGRIGKHMKIWQNMDKMIQNAVMLQVKFLWKQAFGSIRGILSAFEKLIHSCIFGGSATIPQGECSKLFQKIHSNTKPVNLGLRLVYSTGLHHRSLYPHYRKLHRRQVLWRGWLHLTL